MIIFPPCKINIGLQVISRRDDGYHNIATSFYPLPLTDALEIITSAELSFHVSGNAIPGNTKDNLCLKAYHLLKKDYPRLPPVDIYLHKVIPIGAGLGGGSSDAAYMLRLLNTKHRLAITWEKLQKYASMLGSDCAFFLQDRPCCATGRGDQLYPFSGEDLSHYHFMLVCPDIHINTAEAYKGIIPAMPSVPLPDLLRRPIDTWKDTLVNDFEKPVFEAYPALAEIKETLYRHGALYASLSGSGAAVYGIFPKEHKRQDKLHFGNAAVFFF